MSDKELRFGAFWELSQCSLEAFESLLKQREAEDIIEPGWEVSQTNEGNWCKMSVVVADEKYVIQDSTQMFVTYFQPEELRISQERQIQAWR